MAKGYQENKDHQTALALLGKELTRRARSSCELCESSGVSLSAYEVPPAPKQPDLDHCVFICDNCRSQIERPKSIIPDTWRNLANTAWSEVAPVQVMAIRMLRHLAKDQPWAAEILDGLFPEEEIEQRAAAAEIV